MTILDFVKALRSAALPLALYLKLRYTGAMHVISRKTLRLFWERYPESEVALARWFKIVQQTEFRNFAELRAAFPTADKVDNWVVFNVGGNKYRLIASIHFNRGKVYVRHVLTHAEYDRGGWKR
jgi:mRNA interferase HigB